LRIDLHASWPLHRLQRARPRGLPWLLSYALPRLPRYP